MLDKVKLVLGLTTNLYDDDIQDNIDAARAELIRLGISSEKANSDTEPLITRAIKTFCQMQYYEGNESERYRRSWNSQIDNLRKTVNYTEGV